MTFFGDFCIVELIDGRIHATISSKKVKNIGFFGFIFSLRTERRNINIRSGRLLNAFVMHAADGDSDVLICLIIA